MNNNTYIQTVSLLASFMLAFGAIQGCETTHVVHIHNGKPVEPVELIVTAEVNEPEELLPVDITMILDRSGSMKSLAESVISSYNDFIEEQKTVEGEAFVSLIQFDDKYEPNYSNVDIHQAGELNTTTYEPRGRTALFDAIGRSINEAKLRITPGSADVVFVITTDGMENASQEFDSEQIKELIEDCKDQYGWHFMFLAANEDAFNQHLNMGMDSRNCLQLEATPASWGASQQIMSDQMKRYRKDRDATNLEFDKDDDANNEDDNGGC